MKFVLKTLAIGALTGLFFAGCSSATSSSNSTVSLGSASPGVQNQTTAMLSAWGTGFAAAASNSNPNITVTSTSDSDFEIVFNDYSFTSPVDPFGTDTMNGSITFHSNVVSNVGTLTSTGTLTVSGQENGTCSFSISATFTGASSPAHMNESFTIGGTTYTLSF